MPHRSRGIGFLILANPEPGDLFRGLAKLPAESKCAIPVRAKSRRTRCHYDIDAPAIDSAKRSTGKFDVNAGIGLHRLISEIMQHAAGFDSADSGLAHTDCIPRRYLGQRIDHHCASSNCCPGRTRSQSPSCERGS